MKIARLLEGFELAREGTHWKEELETVFLAWRW
jgi:hypothetical protein